MVKNKLFNIAVSDTSFAEYISSSVSENQSYSCFLNSHMIYEYYELEGFKEIIDDADYVLPDGMPVLYSLHLFGSKNQKRIAGNDVIFSLVKEAKEKNLRVFVIGSTVEILNKISLKLESMNIESATYSPPFLPIEDFNFDYQAKIINEFKPDIVMVGLGCPKQEIWMHKMRHKIKGSMYGLGGALLLFAGVDKRAPNLMRILGLEWVYRLALEPRRLFRRYLITNTFFIWLFLKEILKRKFKNNLR